MKISTEIHSASKIVGEERAIEYIAKSGFTAWDFSMFDMINYDDDTGSVLSSSHPLSGNRYLEFAQKLRKIGLDNGIVCNQSHAPFPSSAKEVRSYFKRAIECTAEAGGKICIIHPDNDKTAEENAEMYFELLPFAKSYNVKIATENMWNWNFENYCAAPAACSDLKSFIAHIDAVSDENFVACLDIGHAEMNGLNTSATEMIFGLGNHLQSLHIHDNDCHYDLHELPGRGSIDFLPILKALKEIGYKGDLTLESSSFLKEYTAENVFDGIKKMSDSAKNLLVKYNSL